MPRCKSKQTTIGRGAEDDNPLGDLGASTKLESLQLQVTRLQEAVENDRRAHQSAIDELRAYLNNRLSEALTKDAAATMHASSIMLDEPPSKGDLKQEVAPATTSQQQEEKLLDENPKAESDTTIYRDLSCQEMIAEAEHQFEYNSTAYESAKESWMRREHMYQFAESAWDSSLLAFSEMLRLSDSIFILFMFLVNLGMQCSLTMFSFAAFTEATFTEKDIINLREWRTVVAHDYRWMDVVTHQSLARLVCSSAQAPYLSGMTKATKDVLLQYLPDKKFGANESVLQASFMGQALCLLALFIWWFTCYTEIRNWFYCAQAIANIPRGPRSRFILVKPGDIDDIGIKYISGGRKCWCFIVLFLRLLVAVVLAYMGTLFLVYTLSLRELILNAVALDLMLNVDELVYSTMAPFQVRHFLGCLEPIPKFIQCSWRSIDYDTPLVTIVIISALIATVPLLNTQSAIMDQAMTVLCGGFLDFVYTLDPGGALVAHSTPTLAGSRPENIGPDPEEILDVTATYRWRAVRELIETPEAVTRNPTNSLSDGASAIEGSALSLVERPTIPLGDRMADLNPLCDDWSLDGSSLVWPVEFVQKMYPLHPVFGAGLTCQQGKQYCNWDNEDGIAMRQWCASTCGCNGANSSLILSKSMSGCPNSCQELPYYTATLTEAPCTDHPTSSPGFQSYLDGLRSLRGSYQRVGTWYTMFGYWIDDLEQNGCAAHVLEYNGANFGSLCGNTAFGIKPIVNICPQTCKCSESDQMPVGQPPLCPTKCQNVNSR